MTRIAGTEIDLDRDLPSGPDELWYTRCPVPTAFEVAIDTGLFATEFANSGLRWLQLTESGDPAVHQSHFTHRKANSFRHGGNVPAIYARSRGADTRLIGISWTKTPYPVLARAGSGIETAADLAGRRLLVPVRPEVAIDFWRASTLRVYESALASTGLTLDDVELVEVVGQPHEMAGYGTDTLEGRKRWALADRSSFTRAIIGPLVRGEVDAVAAQTSMAEELQALTGAYVVYDQAEQPDLAARINNGAPEFLTVSGTLADEHPERVAQVVGQLHTAAEWAKEHPRDVVSLFAARLQIPTSVLDLVYGDELSRNLDVDLPAWTADVVRDQHDFLLRHGFIDRPFDIDAWIDPRPLKLARESLSGR